MKTVVVIDTVGGTKAIKPAFMEAFPFVKEWLGFETAAVKNSTPHPHGGMCMEKVLLPLWEEPEGVRACFVRIFAGDGSMDNTAVDSWLWDTLGALASKYGRLYINNSWGAYAGARLPGITERLESYMWRSFIEKTDSVVMWAAGNDGDYYPDNDNDYPQSCLVDCSDKIASARRDGRASDFSGDSVFAPPTAAFWAEDVLLFNPVTGNHDRGSGTSFAAPKATGLAAKHGWNHAQFVAAASSECSKPHGYTGKLPHPKWGYGWFEFSYQDAMRNCPSSYARLYHPATLNSLPTVRWFDYKQLTGAV